MPDKTTLPAQSEGIKPIRSRVTLTVGNLVQQSETVYRIAQLIDFDSVVGINVETGRATPLKIADLQVLEANIPPAHADLAEVSDKDWQAAEKRFNVIKPLVELDHIGRAEASQRAKDAGIALATLYRWIRRYRAFGTVAALIPNKRGWAQGKSRLSPQVDEVIEEVIETYYLVQERPMPARAVEEVQRRCLQLGIEAPSDFTIRARLAAIPEKRQLKGRGYREKARNKFHPVPGSFPNADFPLAVVQIDHTPADIELVDDVHRLHIGRPWLTLAVDVYSAMITGYYLSFDPPSETSVAMCVARSILPKEDWLLLHKVDAKWPVWGVPKTIHVDNGADFRSNTFQQSCMNYGINLEYRPPGQAWYGGHVERVQGTLLRAMHHLPGTTFSSVKQKEGYNSEKHASMTLAEFEEWLVAYICKVYHQRRHKGIGMAPIRKWEIGVFGNAEIQGIGPPPRPSDGFTILLDFLPAFRRTIQPIGVTIADLNYYSEALRLWINATDPKHPGKKREFVFRRDPRDISAIWFFDPEIKEYFKVPFADQSLPPISAWEYQQVREKMKANGVKTAEKHQMLHAISDLRDKVEVSKEKTRKARRQAQRRKEHEKKINPATLQPAEPPKTPPQISDQFTGLLDGDIDYTGEIA